MMLCSCATTNTHLKAWIDSHGRPQLCDLCGANGRPVVDTMLLAEHIDSVVRRHYTSGLDDPEYGEDAIPLIRRLAGISLDVATGVPEVVHDDEPPHGQTFYDYGPLHFSPRVIGEYTRRWGSLKKIVKSEARFLSPETRSILDMILGDMPTFCASAAIRHLAPGERIYRARNIHSFKTALEWFRAPDDSELRAPNEPRANRMNPAGVRVFYGALHDRIAIAEVQPTIGSHVVLGVFTPTRRLTVLDLGALRDVFKYFDIFEPGFAVVSERLMFLRMLEQEVSLPIEPAEDPLGYVPTQIMAEYVHTVLRLDGLAYRSTQTGQLPTWGQLYGPPLEPCERNVALFGAAALTTLEVVPAGWEAGLNFLPEFKQVVDITQIEIHHDRNPQAHYEPPAQGSDAPTR